MSESVSLEEWMRYYGIDWDEALCVNLATDGLDAASDHLLAIGAQFPKEEPEYIYVRGGYPGLTEQYHGITLDRYSKIWVGVKRAQELLRDIVEEAQLLVVGNRSFFQSWQMPNDPPLQVLGDYPVLGLSDYAKFIDSGERLCIGGADESVDKIAQRIAYNVRDMHYQSGYSIRSLFSRIVGELPSTEGVLFENQTVELTRLYCELLWA